MWSVIATVLGGILSSFWKSIFPPKTAAEQKADDLTKSFIEVKDANKISTQVDQKSRAAVDADLAKFVREPGE